MWLTILGAWLALGLIYLCMTWSEWKTNGTPVLGLVAVVVLWPIAMLALLIPRGW
jgi:hypothetical protein